MLMKFFPRVQILMKNFMVRCICHSHRTADILSSSHFLLNCAIHIMPEIYFLRCIRISSFITKRIVRTLKGFIAVVCYRSAGSLEGILVFLLDLDFHYRSFMLIFLLRFSSPRGVCNSAAKL